MSTIGERLKEIRKAQPSAPSQEEFAKSIGTTRTAYAKYEKNIVIPSDPIISLVCMKYNVNPIWLETGEGEPYDPRKPDLGQEIRDIMRGEDPFAAAVMTSLAQMTPEWWAAFREKLYEEVDKQKKNGRG